jgi:hypothetical protein
VFKAVDMSEEFGLQVKMAYQKWKGDDGYLDTLMQWEMEQMDGDMPGNTIYKEAKEELIDLGEDGAYIAEKYGKDAIPLLLKYRHDAVDIIGAYGDEGIALLQNYGDDAVRLIGKYGTPAVKTLAVVEPKAAETLLKTLDKDVLEYASQQGDDAVAALALWGEKDLQEHGVELALRAKKDAQALADVKKLAALGPIDPKNLTAEQKALIDAIAKNSTQYDANGQIALGKWTDFGSGFIENARNTGSKYYGPHPEIWNTLESLGKENQNEAAWLINQQVIKNGISDGLPFEFSLSGIPADLIDNEKDAIETLFTSNPTNEEIMDILKSDYLPVRIKELQELQRAHYQLTFDKVHNSFIFIVP